MSVEFFRRCCLGFPHTTETVQWGNHLVFKVAGKVFCIAALEPAQHIVSFKCSREAFVELTEHPGIVQAPYLARMQWVALEPIHPLSPTEVHALLRISYDLVVAKLPKKTQGALNAVEPAAKTKAIPRAATNNAAAKKKPAVTKKPAKKKARKAR
jgi:predicted DNA-binding protein (MmcQ/YjbR family)